MSFFLPAPLTMVVFSLSIVTLLGLADVELLLFDRRAAIEARVRDRGRKSGQ
jgi:hypothetical protein